MHLKYKDKITFWIWNYLDKYHSLNFKVLAKISYFGFWKSLDKYHNFESIPFVIKSHFISLESGQNFGHNLEKLPHCETEQNIVKAPEV